MSRPQTYRVGLLLLGDFSHFGLVSATQPLFLANWRAQRPIFSWLTLSADGLPVRASNGTVVSVDAGLNARQQLETLLVFASFEPKRHAEDVRLRGALLRAANAGIEIGGVETGSEVLAAAGLLDGRTAAVHWDNLDGFRERYPKVDAQDVLFDTQPGRPTCAGGTTVIDLMLHLVAREAGALLSDEVARQMVVGRPRLPAQRQLAAFQPGENHSDEWVRAAVDLMAGNLDEPLRVAEIAQRVGVSARHLRRRFQQSTATTLTQYYMTLRLSRAHNLLQQTNLSVTEVAITAGFRSLEHFSRVYRAAFGCPPSQDRRQILGAPIHRPPLRGVTGRSARAKG